MDVVEFSYYGAPAPTPKEQLYNELVDGLRGSDPCIGSGSQVHFVSSAYVLESGSLTYLIHANIERAYCCPFRIQHIYLF